MSTLVGFMGFGTLLFIIFVFILANVFRIEVTRDGFFRVQLLHSARHLGKFTKRMFGGQAKFEPNFSRSSDISTQIIETNASVDDVLLAVKETFSHLARSVELSPHSFQTNQLLSSNGYGSLLTNNATQFTLTPKTKGFLITAKTVFGPSLWVLILGLVFIFTLVIPIIMYLLYFHQKHNVRNTIENGLKAISDQLKA